MSERLIVACALAAIWIAAAAGIIWWRSHHSRRRIDARESARRRKAEADHAAKYHEGNQDG